jgi:hypothetical protein
VARRDSKKIGGKIPGIARPPKKYAAIFWENLLSKEGSGLEKIRGQFLEKFGVSWAMIVLELPDEFGRLLLSWVKAQEQAYRETADLMDEGRDASDWFTKGVADDARAQARLLERVRLSIAIQMKVKA